MQITQIIIIERMRHRFKMWFKQQHEDDFDLSRYVIQ